MCGRRGRGHECASNGVRYHDTILYIGIIRKRLEIYDSVLFGAECCSRWCGERMWMWGGGGRGREAADCSGRGRSGSECKATWRCGGDLF